MPHQRDLKRPVRIAPQVLEGPPFDFRREPRNLCLKGGLYLCSTLTAASRVNDDSHYLSQACLGWWMAYLTCRAINQTERQDSRFSLTPMIGPASGLAMTYRW